MTPFEHTLALMSIYHPMGVREGFFLHTPALNSLPKQTYYAGKLKSPKSDVVESIFFGELHVSE